MNWEYSCVRLGPPRGSEIVRGSDRPPTNHVNGIAYGHLGRLVALEPSAAEPAAVRSTLPRGSAAGKGQSWTAAGRCVGIESPGRAPLEERYSSWHFTDPGTINTLASVRHGWLMSRGFAYRLPTRVARGAGCSGFPRAEIHVARWRVPAVRPDPEEGSSEES